MGSGIAQVFAQNGFNTILFDVSEEVLASAKGKIKKYAPGVFDNRCDNRSDSRKREN
jgi:3-hydroxyacyl-CoA dehydrogenase